MATQSSGKGLEWYEALGRSGDLYDLVGHAQTFDEFQQALADQLVYERLMQFPPPPGAAFFLGVNCFTCDVLLSEAGITSRGGRVTCNVCGKSAIPGG